MTIDDYVLSLKNEEGEPLIDLLDYHNKYVRTLSKRLEPWSYYDNKLVLCWFKDHEDVNPSMGYITNKRGIKLYHCFGCGKTGDVIRLHQYIESAYHSRNLNREEAAKDIASLYNIQINDKIADNLDEVERKYAEDLRKIKRLCTRYTDKEFARELMNKRVQKKLDLKALNSECIKLIATQNMLYY